jgi:hypothetical protein
MFSNKIMKIEFLILRGERVQNKACRRISRKNEDSPIMTMTRLTIVLLCLFLCGGCVKKHAAVEPAVAVQAPTLSPMIDFITNAPPGASGWFNDPLYGNVRVVVGRDYLSALGEECRQALIHVSSSCVETIAMCRHDGLWVQAPRIWGGCAGIPAQAAPAVTPAPVPQVQESDVRSQAPDANDSPRFSGRVKTTPGAVVEYKSIQPN